jgi:guanylate kinase
MREIVFFAPSPTPFDPASRVFEAKSRKHMFTKLFQQFFQRNCAKSRGILLVITGPSGVGKDTTKELFIKRNPDFQKIVTDTNRRPRTGEVEGINHNFYSEKDFKKRIDEGKYLEYIEVRPGEYKGTSKEAISAILTGKNVIWQVDEYAMAHIKSIIRDNMPEIADSILGKTVTVYIAPEDWDQLREQYFCRDHEANEEKFLIKLARDREMWWQYHDRYDHVVINKRGKINDTVAAIEKLVAKKAQSLTGTTVAATAAMIR